MPPHLPSSVPRSTLERIYQNADAVPACHSLSGEPVDLLLAEACAQYHRLYLFAEDLPGSLDEFAAVEEYVGLLRQQDPFTAYFPAAEFQERVQPTLRGERALVGVRLEIAGGSETVGPDSPLTIVEVLPYQRGWFDGLRAGDQIVEVHRPPEVSHRPVEGLTLPEVLDLLPTAEGEVVELTVLRDGQTRTIATAAEEHISFLLEEQIGYLGVRDYTSVTGQRVQEDFEALVQESPVDKLILDLRGNGGGSLTGALTLTDYLIDADLPSGTNPILSFDGTLLDDEFRYLGDHSPDDLPQFSPTDFVVLVDESTASASEITVAALQYYGVATVIGTTTFGKGVRQDAVTLADGSGLLITSHFIFPPEGEPYHEIGIEPDIVVAGSVDDGSITPDHDPQLAAAIQFLTSGPAQVSSARRLPAPTARRPARRVDPWQRGLELY